MYNLQDIRITIVLGATRSGKTLLARILRSDKASVHLNEIILSPILANLAGISDPQVQRQIALSLRKYVLDILESPYVQGRARACREYLQGGMTLSDLIYELSNKRKKISHLILESNFFSLCPGVLSSAFPSARFIFMVRDGRDCADRWNVRYHSLSQHSLESMDSHETAFARVYHGKSTPWWVEQGEEDCFLQLSDYLKTVYFWRQMIRRTLDFIELNPDKCLMVKYEDLVMETEDTLAAIARFLGVRKKNISRKIPKFHQDEINVSCLRNNQELLQAEQTALLELTRLKYKINSKNDLPT